ncbi:HAMP domain-containing histidine kinase [Paenibacillus hemerocallicola]|uniref:histidine kinase n=1 Tax=Paenibacillus hemerocallicola TaxID=1172614 RepID=A0A5C4T6Y1_9BACL|nr:HAMP domain-containing sensor histidine kinase [Paenibacillus hemerocallicola]TNJ64854.1 HAMP domain-containing histidine kinase [Paenibacillus hemerocallicola]
MRRGYKFKQSLLSRYLLLLLTALLFIPIAIPASMTASWLVNRLLSAQKDHGEPLRYGTGLDIEWAWHGEAELLGGATDEQLDAKLHELKNRYPDASLFRVDGSGRTRLQLPVQENMPTIWTADYAIAFMKARTIEKSEPFTVVAFIGGDSSLQSGFMVLELPRAFLVRSRPEGRSDTAFFGYILTIMLIVFIFMSYGFFHRIRRRLLSLEAAMTLPGQSGIPLPVSIGRPDEIGQLKMAFNAMIDELTRSKRREKEEEELRQRLIGSLSHDLRTPLTVIGSHLYSLEREPLSGEGRRSIQLMQMKISDLDRLLDHLLSYNLLLNGKYALYPQRMDVLRLVRQSAAAWYPLWESAGLEAELSLPETPIVWEVDEQGFYRVLDNLFQNVVRHAGGGGFIGISVEERYGLAALVIADRGNGMESTGSTKGAGLGLSVVDLLLKEMKLLREAESSSAGTRVYIVPIPI